MVLATDKKKGTMVVLVGLDKILPNPYQPPGRITVDDATAEKFGRSILEHGLIQTPIGRPTPGQPGYYEMGDGWLRRSGYVWLRDHDGGANYGQMPLMVRELTDRQMADLALEANLARQDFTAIDLAHFYKRYLEEFRVTQEELGKSHGCSQGQIANTIRLLELPENVQAAVISGEITPAHARQLVRLKDVKKLLKEKFKLCLERKPTVANLTREVDTAIWNRSCSMTPGKDSWQKPPLFDLTDCMVCFDRQEMASPWGAEGKVFRCFNPDCWKKKQRAVIEISQKSSIDDLKQQGIVEFIHDGRMNWQKYSVIQGETGLDNPGECLTCPRRAGLIDAHGHKPNILCADPKCRDAKRQSANAVASARREATEQKLTDRIKQLCTRVAMGSPDTSASLRLVVDILLSYNDDNPYGRHGISHDVIEICKLPVKGNEKKLDAESLPEFLGSKSLPELISILVAISLTICRREHQSWLAEAIAVLEGKGRKKTSRALGEVERTRDPQ